VGSTIIGVIQHSGDTTYKHAHPTAPISASRTSVAQNNIYKDTEIDTNYKWASICRAVRISSEIEGTHDFGNDPSGFNMFHLASNATVQFGASGFVRSLSLAGGLPRIPDALCTYEIAGYLPLGQVSRPTIPCARTWVDLHAAVTVVDLDTPSPCW